MIEFGHKGIGCICYLLAVFKKKFPYFRVSRQLIQKLLFIFAFLRRYEWGYCIKNSSGPHSDLVDFWLSWLELREYARVEVKGVCKRYIFQEALPEMMDKVDDGDKNLLQQIVEKFGRCKLDKLIIMTTALYLRSRLDIDKKMLIDLMAEARPDKTREQIKKIVERIL